jgi:AcrR family transcriptional regulator
MKSPKLTRSILLCAAFKEVHRKGFNSTSLSDILARTGLTKGAMYHHFKNKKALGHALLDAIEEEIASQWIEPLENHSDPLICLAETTRDITETMTAEDVKLGCPLHNLAQEMSSLDESFREKVAAIYRTWRNSITQALLKGQENGIVDRRVDAGGTAIFFIAALSGSRGLAKNARSTETLRICHRSLVHYLESLRA